MANGGYSEAVGMAMLIINAMMKQARLEQLKLDPAVTTPSNFCQGWVCPGRIIPSLAQKG